MISPLSTYSAALNSNWLPPQRQKLPEAAALSADTVTISNAARAMLSAEAEKPGTSGFAAQVSRAAHDDPQLAEKLAYDYSHSQQVPWLDFSAHTSGTGPIRYAATGEPVTEASESYFNSLSSAVLQGGSDLYAAEKAKGTPAADIVDKLLGYFDALPARYKEMINWNGKATA